MKKKALKSSDPVSEVTPIAELSPERQAEILYQALESSVVPIDFYAFIAPYMPFLSPKILEKYKSKMWIKHLKTSIDSLKFSGLNIREIRKAMVSIEGAYHLLAPEINQEYLNSEEKKVLIRTKSIIKVLRLYKEVHSLMKDLKYIPTVEGFPSTLFMVKGKKLIGALEKEKTKLPGLPSPKDLWKEIKETIYKQGLKAALSRERIFLELMKKEVTELESKMDTLRNKGKSLTIEELASALEKYFGLVIKYNKAISEFRKLEENFPADKEPLKVHRMELEELREALDNLKITEFLAFLISGKELPQP